MVECLANIVTSPVESVITMSSVITLTATVQMDVVLGTKESTVQVRIFNMASLVS